MDMHDPYGVLGLNPSATPEDIKRAWRRLARIHHPDRKGGSQAMMAQINMAYNLLMDPELRARHDAGEPSSASSIEMKAKSALMQIVFAGLTQTQTSYGQQNLYDYIKHQITNNVDKFKGEKILNERQLGVCAAQRKNLTFKEADNPINDVFVQVEDACKENIATADLNISVMARAAELLDEMVLLDAEAAAHRKRIEWLARKLRANPTP